MSCTPPLLGHPRREGESEAEHFSFQKEMGKRKEAVQRAENGVVTSRCEDLMEAERLPSWKELV